MIKRTDQEILARMEKVKDEDWLGTERNDLIDGLSFKAAKPFLKDGVDIAEWEEAQAEISNPLEEIKNYLEFAWDKANNNRGISAWRSLSHMRAWLWLAGEDDFLSRVRLLDYTHYGKPQLRAICEHLEIDWKQYDDGRWTNDEGSAGVGPESVSRVGV